MKKKVDIRIKRAERLVAQWKHTAENEFKLFTETNKFWRDQRRQVWLICAEELEKVLETL